MNKLTDIKCVPCEEGAPTLKENDIKEYLKVLDSSWKVKNEPDKLIRDFEFDDFSIAMDFVNKVAEVAEEEGHHPNIYIHDWNKVKLEIWTHKINGLHKNDFILASKVEQLV